MLIDHALTTSFMLLMVMDVSLASIESLIGFVLVGNEKEGQFVISTVEPTVNVVTDGVMAIELA